MTARLTPAERAMLCALSQRVRSLRILAALLGVTPPTVDRVVMGCRARPETIAKMRAGLRAHVCVFSIPGVH